jgi:hypothetical protein
LASIEKTVRNVFVLGFSFQKTAKGRELAERRLREEERKSFRELLDHGEQQRYTSKLPCFALPDSIFDVVILMLHLLKC